VSSATNSLGSSTSFLPDKLSSLNANFTLPHTHIPRSGEGVRPTAGGHWPAVVLQSGKASRTASANAGELPQIVVKPGERFDRIAMQASLTPQKLADLLRGEPHAPSPQSTLDAPSRERFHEDAAVLQANPAAERFGPRMAETDRSSRLALALSGGAEIELVAFAASTWPLVERPDGVYVAPREVLEASLETGSSLLDAFPDVVPLPTIRPTLGEARIAAAPSAAAADSAASTRPEPQKLAKAPAKTKSDDEKGASHSNNALAYAKPDNPTSSFGQAFKNLFSPRPRRNGGVAVYDISAHTVYMPDGQRLEAHSGLGKMVDDPRYVKVKNRGPTPPNTYNLVMRESLFHGVEAIRLLPVDGKNKFNRDGLLAHTYMLRGGLEQSNGCVVFEHYDRFLKAFKKGEIRQLVVVPGNGRARMRLASYGRGA
jgi:hypothetical protein